VNKRRKLPAFVGGIARVQLLVALSIKGPLTTNEIMRLSDMSRDNVDRADRTLVEIGILTTYRWCCIERHLRVTRTIWALDHRHPWYPRFKNLGRRLHIAFPLSGSMENRRRRRYRGQTTPQHASKRIRNLFGSRDEHRIVMLLAHTGESGQKYPIRTLALRLGIDRNSASVATTYLEKRGIVTTEWQSQQRLVRLDRRFLAWCEIRRLAHLMDRECGSGEFAALAKAHLWDRNVNKKRRRLRKKGPKATL
jgi:DNA-binding transcriptional ArsR family regulator